jgi:TrmH family RNA methyltransferase
MSGESVYMQDLTQPTAFVIGNEGAGLRKQTVAAATKSITIPMASASVESLNAGAAAAVCLFERKRQLG